MTSETERAGPLQVYLGKRIIQHLHLPQLDRRWTIVGKGYLTSRRILGVWFFRRTTFQFWSPLLHEITVHRGIRIRHLTIGWTATVKHFKDGREPTWVKGEF